MLDDDRLPTRSVGRGAWAIAALGAADPASAPALAGQLIALARTLERKADDQESVDALRNASAYRRAAAWIAQAARLMAGRG